MVLQGLAAAIISSLEDVAFRYMLTAKRMTWQKFSTLTFSGLFVFLIPLLPFFFSVHSAMFSVLYLSLMLGAVLVSVVRSVLHFNGMKHSKIENVEPLALSSWIFTILLAVVFFPDERNLLSVILALVASLSIISINIKKYHFKMDKYALYVVVAAFFWAIHAILLKMLLDVYNPLMLIFVRSFLVSVFFIALYKIEKSDFKNGKWKWLSFVSVLDVGYWGFLLWSYQAIGIVMTSLLLTLAPLMAEGLAKVFLKEKLHWKNFVATVIVCACITISLLV